MQNFQWLFSTVTTALSSGEIDDLLVHHGRLSLLSSWLFLRCPPVLKSAWWWSHRWLLGLWLKGWEVPLIERKGLLLWWWLLLLLLLMLSTPVTTTSSVAPVSATLLVPTSFLQRRLVIRIQVPVYKSWLFTKINLWCFILYISYHFRITRLGVVAVVL